MNATSFAGLACTRSLCALAVLTAPLAAQQPETDPSPTAVDAIDDIRDGDYEAARKTLGRLLVKRYLDEARASLEAGQAREALVPLDEAVVIDPRSAEAWYLRGTAAWETAVADTNAAFFFPESLDNFEKAVALGYGTDAVFRASRAARMALQPEKALQYAKRGMLEIEGRETPLDIGEMPEKIAAQAHFDQFVVLKQAEQDAPELFRETQRLLRACVRATPTDSWGYTQLANLYAWEGRQRESVQMLERALDVSPTDAALHERLVDSARNAFDRNGVLAAYGRFNAKHAGSPLGVWYPAVETFLQASDDLTAGSDSSIQFEEAEKLFRKCRELDAQYEQACRGYEAMCRAGIGWCLYNDEDWDGAIASFRSMEDLLEGGMQWQFEGRLLSGVVGLQFVADHFAQQTTEADAQEKAAEIFGLLHAYDRQNADFANNTGFFHREAMVLVDMEAEELFRQARETQDEPTRTLQLEQARNLRRQSLELMERCIPAYQAAAELAPDNVRFVNDCGLVMVYHERKDIDAAEAYLRRAAELGEVQLQNEQLSEEDRDQLTEAWGDAYQNLGLLYLTLRNDPVQAKAFFERSVEIGPLPRVPREIIQDSMIPACDAALEGPVDFRAMDPRLWAFRGPDAVEASSPRDSQ